MGLAVHFKLSAPASTTAAGARRFVTALHREALRFQREGLVDAVPPMASDLETVQRFACGWLILPYLGIVHHNDDNTRLVGIFVFRVNKDLYFAPVFFINGNIKGTDLFYRHSTKSFVPLNKRWLEYLISRSETSEGHGVPISERTNTRRQLNLMSIVQPPAMMNYGSNANAKFASIEVPDDAEVKRLAQNAWNEIKYAAIPELPTESILRRFIVQDGGFNAIKKIASTCQHDKDFAEALMLSSSPENYMPDINPEKAASAPQPLLQIHFNVLHNPNVKSAGEQDLHKGYVFEDKRAADTVNEVIHDIGERNLESVTQPGVHHVLVADGSNREMICAYHRTMFRCTDDLVSNETSHAFQSSGSVLPFCLIDTGNKKSLDLDILPSAKTWRVLGVYVKPLSSELGQAKPEANKMYRVLNLKTSSISEPVYVKSVKQDELGLTQVEYRHPYSSKPETVTLNPDYENAEPAARIFGKNCVWVEVAEEKEASGPTSCHCADNDIRLGDRIRQKLSALGNDAECQARSWIDFDFDGNGHSLF